VQNSTEALAEEERHTKLKISCLAPGATETGFADAADMRSARLFRVSVMTAEAVARIGYDGFRKGKVVVITGLRNKLLVQSVRLSPRFMVRKITHALNK